MPYLLIISRGEKQLPKKIAIKYTGTSQHRFVNCVPRFKLLHGHAYRIINQFILLVFV